jgi:predicted nucleic acid-binding protein
VRELQQMVFAPFERRRRVFAPSAVAFVESGRALAGLAAAEGWQTAAESPSLLNDALIAVSCREQGITLITKDTDFKRLAPFVRGFHYSAPWPLAGTRLADKE